MVRLVDTDLGRPQLTAAIDEALLGSLLAGHSADTIHLYRRRPPSVSIGYFFTDERQLVYALAFRPSEPIKAREGLVLTCVALVRALGRLGVGDAKMSGINDVVVGDAKVSGSAQVIRRGVHLVHGTLLVDVDKQALARYLLPQDIRASSREHPTPAARVTTLVDILGSLPPMDVVKAVVAEELAGAVGGVPKPGHLNTWELDEVDRLLGERYENDEWNLRR